MQTGKTQFASLARSRFRLSFTSPTHARPMSEMNVTPFIDVLLVLIIMLIMVVPIATHSLDVPLPSGPGGKEVLQSNTISIDRQDHLYWNGEALSRQELLNQLATAAMDPRKPLLRFEPEAQASYDISAKTIALIKDSGAENFAFVGNHQYRDFSR